MKTKIFLCKEIQVFKNKSIELQLSRWEDSPMFSAEYYNRGSNQDHKGFSLSVTLFYHEVRIDFYDHRHSEGSAE